MTCKEQLCFVARFYSKNKRNIQTDTLISTQYNSIDNSSFTDLRITHFIVSMIHYVQIRKPTNSRNQQNGSLVPRLLCRHLVFNTSSSNLPILGVFIITNIQHSAQTFKYPIATMLIKKKKKEKETSLS